MSTEQILPENSTVCRIAWAALALRLFPLLSAALLRVLRNLYKALIVRLLVFDPVLVPDVALVPFLGLV